MSPRYLLLPLLLITWTQTAAAALKTPDCAAIASWAATFQMEPAQMVAPEVTLPASVSDEELVPLFGQSITGWTRDDFRTFKQQMASCQRALFKTDREAANQINAVRKSFQGISRSVRNLASAAEQADKAVEQLLALPESPQTRQVLDVAETTLDGADSDVRSLPREAQRPVTQLKRVYPNLVTATAEELKKRVRAHNAELQAAEEARWAAAEAAAEQKRQRLAAERAQAEARAIAELQAARSELDALPASPESLAELDRLAALPALATAPPDDATAFRRALDAKRQAIDEIVQRERAAKMQDELSERLTQLRGFEIDELADLGTYWKMRFEFTQLVNDPANAEALAAIEYDEAERRIFGERFDAAATELLPTFTERIFAIPDTEAGMQQLRTSIIDLTGVRVRATAMQPYEAAVRERAKAIDAKLRHAAEWLPIAPRLEAMLQGDDVDDLTIRGLSPGMPHAEAVGQVKRQWGFEQVPDLSLTTTYGLGRKAQRQLAPERRDGGNVKLEDMDEHLGQISFTEYYKAKIELDVLREWLAQRFGKPDTAESLDHGLSLSWRDGPQRLQVKAINQVDVMRFNVGFRSQLALALWNDDYEDYAEKASERCDEIRKMPRNEISIEESMFFTTKCSLGMGSGIKPGL